MAKQGPTTYLYTVNNDLQRNGVAVLRRNADGSLTEIAGSPFSTGGKGLGGGDIDQQGAVRVHGEFVLAVNPGSDSVAVLRKGEGGKLQPVAGSPFPSGGLAPISLTVHGDLVYVANQAPFFAKPTTGPNVTGFRMGTDGTLTPIPGSTIAFLDLHGPAQVEFNPGGETVAVTSGFQEHATSQVHGYKVQADGTLEEGPGSPAHATGASGNVGFAWSSAGDRIYVTNFRRSAVTVFDVDKQTGGVKQVGRAHQTKGSAACWGVLSSDGTLLYVANFVSNTISTLAVRADGTLTFLSAVKRRGGHQPDTKDLALSKDGQFLYAVASTARQVATFTIGGKGKLKELPAPKSPAKLRAGGAILGLVVD